jgi:hypothetical protein
MGNLDVRFPDKGTSSSGDYFTSRSLPKIPLVNVLYCTSQRQSRPIKATEVMLNGADGLNWETFVGCDLIYLVESAALHDKRGRVCRERRLEVWRKMTAIFSSIDD